MAVLYLATGDCMSPLMKPLCYHIRLEFPEVFVSGSKNNGRGIQTEGNFALLG